MINILKNNKGFVAAEAALGIGIFLILSTLVIALLLNVYNINLSNHRLAMATNYAVEILENAKLLDYYDTNLNAGNYEGNEVLGINMSSNYTAELNITDYNKTEGNEDKEDLIKILELTINYTDGDLDKNLKISTLKINK